MTTAMRLLIERSELLRALSHVASVVERRTTIPVLSNVLIRALPGTLSSVAPGLWQWSQSASTEPAALSPWCPST